MSDVQVIRLALKPSFSSTNSLVAYMYLNLFCMPFIPLYFSIIIVNCPALYYSLLLYACTPLIDGLGHAKPSKMCRVTPYVFFLPLPPFARARGSRNCAYGKKRTARETIRNLVPTSGPPTSLPRNREWV